MMRRPTWPERILQVILVVGIVLILWSMVDVLTAPTCQSGAEFDAGGCYPWGFEGPFAEFWAWRSRENALLAQFLQIVSCIAAFALPYVVRRRWITLPAMILFPIASSLAQTWLPHFMGW